MIRNCLHSLFGEDWVRPTQVSLVSGEPPFLARRIFQGKEWTAVDKRDLYDDPRAVLELTPPWFVYYTPLFFLIALEDTATPPLQTSWPEVLTLYVPGNMFDGAFRSIESNDLSSDQAAVCYKSLWNWIV